MHERRQPDSVQVAIPTPATPPPASDAFIRVRAAARGVLPVMMAAMVLAGFAWVACAPLLTPPLGASVYVCFHNRGRRVALPRTLIVSHLVAILSARFATLVVGATPVTIAGPYSVPVMCAVVLALVLTVFLLDVIGCQHPPAGATTVLIAYGLLELPGQVALLSACVVLAMVIRAYDLARLRWITPNTPSQVVF